MQWSKAKHPHLQIRGARQLAAAHQGTRPVARPGQVRQPRAAGAKPRRQDIFLIPFQPCHYSPLNSSLPEYTPSHARFSLFLTPPKRRSEARHPGVVVFVLVLPHGTHGTFPAAGSVGMLLRLPAASVPASHVHVAAGRVPTS